jgi:hypothetical protein
MYDLDFSSNAERMVAFLLAVVVAIAAVLVVLGLHRLDITSSNNFHSQ